MWLSWFSVVPQSERALVRPQVRAQAWVVGLVPRWGVCKRQLIDISLSRRFFSPSSLPSPLSKNKYVK